MTSTHAHHHSAEVLVGRLFDIIDHRRWDELGSVFSPDCVYDRPGYEPFVGLDRLVGFYRYERVIAAGGHEVERVVGDAGSAACWGVFSGEDKAGDPLRERFADTYLLGADGRIRSRSTYFHRAAI